MITDEQRAKFMKAVTEDNELDAFTVSMEIMDSELEELLVILEAASTAIKKREFAKTDSLILDATEKALSIKLGDFLPDPDDEDATE